MNMEDLKTEQKLVAQGNILDTRGEFGEAIAAYDLALEIVPGDADALYNKGETLVKLGRIPEAVKCFETATLMYVGDAA